MEMITNPLEKEEYTTLSSFTISNKKEEMEKVRPTVDSTESNASSNRDLN
jgi:hypothetical protein